LRRKDVTLLTVGVVEQRDPRANKTEIKQAVQVIWDVTVTSVNTLNRRGKVKRRGYTKGKRADEKRAIVTLAEGDSIEIFEGGLG